MPGVGTIWWERPYGPGNEDYEYDTARQRKVDEEMDEPLKLCKDCKHVKYVPYITFIPSWVDKSFAKCNSPRSLTRTDLLTGEKVKYTEFCSSQRIGDFLDGRSCGESGKWWESK